MSVENEGCGYGSDGHTSSRRMKLTPIYRCTGERALFARQSGLGLVEVHPHLTLTWMSARLAAAVVWQQMG